MVYYSSIFLLSSTQDGLKTKLTYVFRLTLSSSLDRLLRVIFPNLDRAMIINHRPIVISIKLYFQKRHPLDLVDSEDIAAMSAALFAHTRGRKISRSDVAECIDTYRALQQIAVLFPWFDTALTVLLQNKLYKPIPVRTALELLSESEAEAIFRGLAASFASNPSTQSAIDEWRLQYPAHAIN